MSACVRINQGQKLSPLTASMFPTSPTSGTALARRFKGVFPLVVCLSLVLCVVNLWALNTDIFGLLYDDGIYTVVAKSLSEGEGYRIISLDCIGYIPFL